MNTLIFELKQLQSSIGELLCVLRNQSGETGGEQLNLAFEQIELALAGQAKWKASTLVEQCAVRPDLHAALIEAGCGDPKNVNLVGYWLRTNRGRRAGGRVLETVGNETKSKASKMWRVRRHTP